MPTCAWSAAIRGSADAEVACRSSARDRSSPGRTVVAAPDVGDAEVASASATTSAPVTCALAVGVGAAVDRAGRVGVLGVAAASAVAKPATSRMARVAVGRRADRRLDAICDPGQLDGGRSAAADGASVMTAIPPTCTVRSGRRPRRVRAARRAGSVRRAPTRASRSCELLGACAGRWAAPATVSGALVDDLVVGHAPRRMPARGRRSRPPTAARPSGGDERQRDCRSGAAGQRVEPARCRGGEPHVRVLGRGAGRRRGAAWPRPPASWRARSSARQPARAHRRHLRGDERRRSAAHDARRRRPGRAGPAAGSPRCCRPQRERAVGRRVGAGDVGADLDQLLDVPAGGDQPAGRRGRARAARAW